MINNLSIVMIVKEDRKFVEKMLKYHPEIYESDDVIVIDSGGGEVLSYMVSNYEKIDLPIGLARTRGISKAKNKYTLIVDVDTELPINFIEISIEILERHKYTAVVAIDYTPLLGHLNIGASIWRTNILKEIHDWKDNKNGRCECVSMWGKVRKKGYNIETLIIGAIHHKGEKEVNK